MPKYLRDRCNHGLLAAGNHHADNEAVFVESNRAAAIGGVEPAADDLIPERKALIEIRTNHRDLDVGRKVLDSPDVFLAFHENAQSGACFRPGVYLSWYAESLYFGQYKIGIYPYQSGVHSDVAVETGPAVQPADRLTGQVRCLDTVELSGLGTNQNMAGGQPEQLFGVARKLHEAAGHPRLIVRSEAPND